jgi:glutathione S-transferase
VAWFGLGVAVTIALVVLMLLWRWLIVMSGILAPEDTPPVVLEAIAVSHFVEKARWCLDRLGIDYVERQNAATLGAYFTGRSVPQLRVRTGIVQSVIGNSPEILRFLWGNYSVSMADSAGFLEPTEERLALEKRLDQYGRFLQVCLYHHVLNDRELTLGIWGVNNPEIPAWQKPVLRLLFPVLAALVRRSFRINEAHYAKAVLFIDELLADIDTQLADGRGSILGGDTINYTDIAFAAFSALWMQPEGYGGDKAELCRIKRDQMPALMRADIERWLEDHPKATTFVERLYAEQR